MISNSEQLSVGVGALAGSTIMLLTIPWFLSIVGGRVNVDPKTGKAVYKTPKLTPPDSLSLTETGVALSPAVNNGAYVMILTAVSYLILQVPGMMYLNNTPVEQAAGEKHWAQLGAVLCLTFFVGYLYQQYKICQDDITQKRIREEYLRSAILSKKISLTGVMIAELAEYKLIHPKYSSHTTYQSEESRPLRRKSSSEMVQPLNIPEEFMNHLERILKPFFKIYDENGDGVLNKQELVAVFRELGEEPTADEVNSIFAEFDADNSGSIEYSEFVAGVAKYIVSHSDVRHRHMARKLSGSPQARDLLKEADEEDEEEEVPEELKNLSPDEQQSRIKMRAAVMMGLGTLIVLLVSDPMVEVMSELGARTGIPAFYIAFVLAPLASNASELIAAYNYSLKKTASSMSISLSTLEGAAVMNNTFVLGIFMLLICTQSLVWEFFAETLTILLVQVCIAVYALKSTHTVMDGCFILALYPLSLMLVAGLEAMGWN